MQPIKHTTEQAFNFEPKPLWILSTKHLSQDTAPARYRFTAKDGETKSTILSKLKRLVVDTLLQNELFCASTVRIGDVVFRLKEDDGIYAETLTLANGRKYYSLAGKVAFVGPVATDEVAA